MTRVRSTPLAELPVDKRTPRKLHLPPNSNTRPGAQQASTALTKGRVPSTPLQNATGVSPSPTKPVAGKQRPVLSKRASSYTNGVNSTTAHPRKTVSANTSPVKVAHRPREQGQQSPPKAPVNSPAAVNGVPSKGPSATDTPAKASTPNSKPNVNARRAVSGPAQMNGREPESYPASKTGEPGGAAKKTSPNHDRSHVNGIVRQLNGVNGSDSARDGRHEDTGSGTALDGFGVHRAGAPSETGTTGTAAKSVAGTTSGSSEELDRRQPMKLKRKVPG